MIMLPSDISDFSNPEIARLIGKTQQSSAASSEMLRDTRQRARLGRVIFLFTDT